MDFVIEGNAHKLAHEVRTELSLKQINLIKGPVSNLRLVKQGLTIDLTELIGGSIQSDLARRDFTINTLAFSLKSGELLDVFEGLRDLKLKLIRSVSPEAFSDDPLRTLRALRFVCTLQGFSLTEKTWEEIQQHAPMITRVSAERIKGELDRIIASPKAVNGFKNSAEAGLFQFIFREFFSGEAATKMAPGFDLFAEQNNQLNGLRRRIEDSFNKLATGVEQKNKDLLTITSTEEKFLAYASIFASLRDNLPDGMKDHSTAMNHKFDQWLEKYAFFMKRQRFSNLEIKRINNILSGAELLKQQLHTHPINRGSLRYLINRVGWDIKLSLSLLLAETFVQNQEPGVRTRAQDLVEQIINLLVVQGETIINPPVLVTGEEVSEVTGLTQGVRLGQILNRIRSYQIKGSISTRQEALILLHKILREARG
ncbi:MAG: hypothetical protein HY730_03640 [Candidatus Tectomicrobia bacterium]|uniref:CCA tRNA nucleotidyltransferase n=1 Tax=Tectimicrobiota bacterium TaxID=2528274 RepID=A0A933LPT5_UNCTE|nr:hypothetical protein [Candidatus Tectomicrobia bacterium]